MASASKQTTQTNSDLKDFFDATLPHDGRVEMPQPVETRHRWEQTEREEMIRKHEE